MLYDGAGHCEFVLRAAFGRGCGFGDEGFEDGVDDAVVPVLCLVVVVGGGGGESRVTGIVADLFEA